MLSVIKLIECNSLVYVNIDLDGNTTSLITEHTAVKMMFHDLYINKYESEYNLSTLTTDYNRLVDDRIFLEEISQQYVKLFDKCDSRFYTI